MPCLLKIKCMKLNKINFCLAVFVIFSCNVTAQDSIKLILEKIDGLEKKIDGLGKNVDNKPASEKKSDLEELKNKIKGLEKTIIDDKARIDLLDKEKNDNAKQRDEHKTDLFLKGKELGTKEKELNDLKLEYDKLISEEKESLKSEINAILNQSYTLPNELIVILSERCLNPKLKPDNYENLKKYSDTHRQINKAFDALESAYNSTIVKPLIIATENIVLDNKVFSGLVENKNEVLYLLKNYCTKSNAIAKIIKDANPLTDINLRKEFLENNAFESDGYPFLNEQLQNAIKDKTFSFKEVNCQ